MEIKITGNNQEYLENLKNGDLFFFEQELYLKIKNDRSFFLEELKNVCLAIHLKTGAIEEFSHKDIVTFPKKSILNIDI